MLRTIVRAVDRFRTRKITKQSEYVLYHKNEMEKKIMDSEDNSSQMN